MTDRLRDEIAEAARHAPEPAPAMGLFKTTAILIFALAVAGAVGTLAIGLVVGVGVNGGF